MVEALLAAILVAVAHALRLRYGLIPADEGFLWNGVLRIGQGQIPIRDYKSYDPFRFYWCWVLMRVFGDGIVGLRHAIALFQALGLWAGLSALSTVTYAPAALALAGLCLVLWMLPRHKAFEHAICLIGILALTHLLAAPSPVTAFWAGLVTGFAWLVGRNHVAYLAAAMALAFGLLVWHGLPEEAWPLIRPWALGAVLGIAPLLAMFVAIRGMFSTYLHQKVLVFLRRDRSNVAKPAPLPWRATFRGQPLLTRLSTLSTGLHFIAMPVFAIGGLCWAILGPDGPGLPVITAAALAGLFYMHHAATRSDPPHLCQATQPLILGLCALAFSSDSAVIFWGGPLLLLPLGWLVARQVDARLMYLENPGAFEDVEIRGERFKAVKPVARLIVRAQALAAKHFAPEDRGFIAPRAAMLYPILGKATPVRSDFMLFAESAAAQARIIRDLERNRVRWALIQNNAPDRREGLRFRNTHTDVWTHIQTHFEPVDLDGFGAEWSFWRRKAPPETV